MKKSCTGIFTGGLLLALYATMGAGVAGAESVHQQIIATELNEVHTGSLNGRDYLTIHIDGNVGPATCRGNILKIDTSSFTKEGKQEAIESVALSAMLSSEAVMITVPLRADDCLDGMPTVSDMYLLPTSP